MLWSMNGASNVVPEKRGLYNAIREEHDLKKSLYREKQEEYARLAVSLQDLWREVQALHQVGWSCLEDAGNGCPFGDEAHPPPADLRPSRSYVLEVLDAASAPLSVAEVVALAEGLGWRSESKNKQASMRTLLHRLVSEELVERDDKRYVAASVEVD